MLPRGHESLARVYQSRAPCPFPPPLGTNSCLIETLHISLFAIAPPTLCGG